MSNQFYNADLNTFKLSASLFKDSTLPSSGRSFSQVLKEEVKSIAKTEETKAVDVVKDNDHITKKKEKSINLNELPDINKIVYSDKKDGSNAQRVNELLDQFKSERKSKDEDPFSQNKQRAMQNINNAAGQAFIQPDGRQGQRRMTRSQIMSAWERLAPSVTEDPMRKSVRIDIPMLNDVRALILRMNPDRSITASLLGSEVMQDLIRNNKPRLDKTLKHHHLSLKEFNTYVDETTFTGEAGTRKKKPKKQNSNKKTVDII